VIVLEPEWTIAEIDNAINHALSDPIELQRKSAAGLSYARQHATWTRHADRIVQAVQEYRAGARGYAVRLSPLFDL
jgi:glycosyltransferase involved in cell wall biosynthesis